MYNYKKALLAAVLASCITPIAIADEAANNDFPPAEEIGTNVSPDTGTQASGFTSDRGIYVGAQLGMSNLHYKGSSYTSATSRYDDSYKFAGRAFLGYSFSQFISAEFGYDYYGRPKFINNTNGNTQDILQHGVDLVAKATLPLDYGFGLYAKAGMACIYRTALRSNGGTFVNKDANTTFAPVGAIGAQYWFVSNMALDLSWTKTMSISDLPTSDLVTAGLIYRINI